MQRKVGRANLLNGALKPELTGEVWCVLSLHPFRSPPFLLPVPSSLLSTFPLKRGTEKFEEVADSRISPPVRVWDSNPACSYPPVAVVKSFWLCGLRVHILFKNNVFLSNHTYTLLLVSLLN